MGEDTLVVLDRQLAERYGSYAGYAAAGDPIAVDFFRDNPADEVDRLLDVHATCDRLLNHRKIYLFRRTPVQYFPAAPELRPCHVP